MSWSFKNDMPAARSSPAVGAIGNKLYVTMGYIYTTGLNTYASTYEWNRDSNTWTQKANSPQGLYGSAGGVIGDKFYFAGGASASNSVYNYLYEYNPATDTWTEKAGMPSNRCMMGNAVSIGTKLYIGGGTASATSYSGQTNFWEWDQATNSWSSKASMPLGLDSHSMVAVGTKVYVFGGRTGGSTMRSEVYEWDQGTNTWTQKASIPRQRHSGAAAVMDGKVYAIGGALSADKLDIYDPATNTWTSGPDLPETRSFCQGAGMEYSFYVPGGDGVGGVTENSLLEFMGNRPPDAPTGLSISSEQVRAGKQGATISWTHNDPDSDPQTQYRFRWRRVV